MLLRAQAARALRCLLPGASRAGSPGLAGAAAAAPAAAAAQLLRAVWTSSTRAAAGPAKPKDVQGEDAPAAVDAETGLPLSVPPARELRDTVEEIAMCATGQLTRLCHAQACMHL